MTDTSLAFKILSLLNTVNIHVFDYLDLGDPWAQSAIKGVVIDYISRLLNQKVLLQYDEKSEIYYLSTMTVGVLEQKIGFGTTAMQALYNSLVLILSGEDFASSKSYFY